MNLPRKQTNRIDNTTLKSNQHEGIEITPDNIIHFDATLARRNRMRQSSQEPSDGRAKLTKRTISETPKTEQIVTNDPNIEESVQPTVTPAMPDISAWKQRVVQEVAPQDISAQKQSIVDQKPVQIEIKDSKNEPNANQVLLTDSSSLLGFLRQFVIEQTGYPEEIVDVDADLEADLGIDSIKKAQMLGEVNEYFAIDVASLDVKSLDEFKTLQSIVDLLSPHIQGGKKWDETTSRDSARWSSQSSINTAIDDIASSGLANQSDAQKGMSSTSQILGGAVNSNLKVFVVQFVVEQTGYPEDIIEFDADLEADLGIDSIKKAQMFGEINEYFDLNPSDFQGITLDDFKSLQDIIDFLTPYLNQSKSVERVEVFERSERNLNAINNVATIAAPRKATTGVEPASATDDGTRLESFLVQFVVEQTGYPEEIVELDADLEADLGIDSIKKAQLLGEVNEYFELRLTSQSNMSLDDFKTLRDILEFVISQNR